MLAKNEDQFICEMRHKFTKLCPDIFIIEYYQHPGVVSHLPPNAFIWIVNKHI